MRTVTTITKVYSFDELSEEGKEKALHKLYDINVNFDWWEYTYEDARQIGLEITGFNDYQCTGKFIEGPEEAANLILNSHGKTCETYKTAKEYQEDRNELVRKYSDGKNINRVTEDNEYDFDNDCDQLDQEFLKSILEDYRIILRNEYEYLTSEEAIIETIEANEYEFIEDGEIF